jgi:chromosome segregation ATPase
MNKSHTTVDEKDIYQKDAEQRQKLIDRLYTELDRKTDTLQKLSKDYTEMKKTNQGLQEMVWKLEAKLEESDVQTQRLINSFDIDIIPLEELRRRYALLCSKLESAMQQIKAQNEGMLQLDALRADAEQLTKERNALRQAHTAQQNLVLDLQESVQKSQRFKSVISKQEEIISKLEQQIEHQKLLHTSTHSSIAESSLSSVESIANEELLALRRENSQLREEIRQLQLQQPQVKKSGDHSLLWNILQQENALLKEQLREREQRLLHKGDTVALILRAESAEAKCKALELQVICTHHRSLKQPNNLENKSEN